MRQSTSLCPPLESAIATSHSSLAQTSAPHQSPEERHGPEAQTIFPRIALDAAMLRAAMRTGSPARVCTSGRHEGRNMLKPIKHCEWAVADCGVEVPFLCVTVSVNRV